MKFQQKYYQLNHGHISAIEIGDVSTSSTTVLCLHGWLDNAASFESTLNVLSEQDPDLHLCAIDLPGHGFSSHKAEGNYYPFHDYIDDLYQLLSTHLNHRKVVLVGHSLGALIASCVSSAFPELVSGFVQIEGVGPLPEIETNTVNRLREGVISRKRVLNKPPRTFDSLEPVISRRAKLNKVASKLIELIIVRGTEKVGDAYCWRHDIKLQCQSVYRMSFPHADELLKHIRCPHSIILGDSGYPELKERVEQLEEVDFKLKVISGGHHCHLENPSNVANIILALVNKI